MSKRKTFAELVVAIATRSGVSRARTRRILRGLEMAVAEALARGEKVQLRDFGTLELRASAARHVRHPRTGALFFVAAGNRVRFRPRRPATEPPLPATHETSRSSPLARASAA